MKLVLISFLAVLSASVSFAQATQGMIICGNNVTGFRAPIYGPDPGNPDFSQAGQSSIGTPTGSTVYGGLLLKGSGYTMGFYVGPQSADSNALTLRASTTFRTSAGNALPAGLVAGSIVTVPDVPAGQPANFQIRVWDNQSGSVTNWSQAVTFNADRGASPIVLSAPLGGTDTNFNAVPTPNDTGWTSFNIFHVDIFQTGPPFITEQPRNIVALVGANTNFYVTAAGSLPLSYQWQFNGTNLDGATNVDGTTHAVLSITNVQPENGGAYSVIVSNSEGVTNSATVQLDTRFAFVYGNGPLLLGTNYTFSGSVNISLQSGFPNANMFYVLNGSQPTFFSDSYSGPFVLTHNALIRVLVYNADFTESGESVPLRINVIPNYNLSTSTPGGGTISLNPPTGPYSSNTIVSVTATPNSGWIFLGWLGDSTGSNATVNVTMNRDRSVQAIFGTTLGKTVTGNGTVTMNPSAALYPFGTVVRFSATPQSGNYFAVWGNATNGTANPLYFTVASANQTVSSLFQTLGANQAALTVNPDGFGQINVNPRANVYTTGTQVTLAAVPDAGQSFLGWSGDASGTNNPLGITMNQSMVITGSFTRNPMLLAEKNPATPTDSGFRGTLIGELGATYTINVSTDRVSWDPLLSLTNTLGKSQFADPGSGAVGIRFYRAVQTGP